MLTPASSFCALSLLACVETSSSSRCFCVKEVYSSKNLDALAAEAWLGTGDLGHFDDGFLVLHGRKKHQFVTAYGRNVNPEWVAAELVQQAPIAQAWLYGEALADNLAVLVPRSATLGGA